MTSQQWSFWAIDHRLTYVFWVKYTYKIGLKWELSFVDDPVFLGDMRLTMLDEGGHVLLALSVASLARWLASVWSSRVRRGRFVRVGKVTELNIYPVKSCPGIPLERAKAENAGLVSEGLHDRCFIWSFVLFFLSYSKCWYSLHAHFFT